MSESAFTERELNNYINKPGEMAKCPAEQFFALSVDELEYFQLSCLQQRLADLAPKVTALNNLVEENKIAELNHIHDVVPLLFPHTVYKSYPLSLIDNCRFTQLNDWLNEYTSHDISCVDVSHCQSLDEWLEVLETETPIRVLTSSGTSGKISLLPRSTTEDKNIPLAFTALYKKFNNEQGLDDIYAPHVYHVFPFARYGRHITGHVIRTMIQYGFDGKEDNLVTLQDRMSTDILWMTGRLKKAHADGTVEQLKKTKAWKKLSGKLEELKANPGSSHEEFYRNMLIKLEDKTAIMSLGLNYFKAMIECAEKYGLELRFAPDSFLTAAGGLKGVSLTDEEIQGVKDTIPHYLHEVYACSELFSGLARKCPEGRYHAPPWLVHFVLDPDTGAPYPRTGLQTGRYAGYDLWAETYWGGFITGDEVTINWDGGCACGRGGPYLHGKVVRYTDKHGGDDKITCQRTAAAVQEMVDEINQP